MGQASSKPRDVNDTLAPSTSRPNPDSVRHDNEESAASTSTQSRKRKSRTIRRSIINLVKPSTQNDDPATSGNRPNNGKRKSWLKSKRWSKTPGVSEPQPAVPVEEVSSGEAATATSEGTGNPVPATAAKDAETTTTALTIPISSLSEASHPHTTLDSEPEQAPDTTMPPDSVADEPPSIAQNNDGLSAQETSTDGPQAHSDLQSSQSLSPLASFESPSADPPISIDHEARSRLLEVTSDPIPRTEGPADSNAESELTEAPQTTPHTPSTPTASPQNRQFPPPGTLVVVQGVVHTTDVPRPTSNAPSRQTPTLSSTAPSSPIDHHDSHPPSNVPSSHRLSDSGLGSRIRRSASNASRRRSDVGVSTRNRLSALFGGSSRPASMVSSRSSPSASNTTVDETSSADGSSTPPSLPAAETITRPASGLSSHTPDTTPSSSNPLVASTSTARTESDSVATTVSPTADGLSGANDEADEARRRDQGTPSQPTGAGVISSSSIDVLGTLLSVAAAATAASLLTGSSEPILPRPVSPANSPQTDASIAPTSTVDGGSDPFGVDGMGWDEATANSRPERTDRVRQAWGNIRDRLGLGLRTSNGGNGHDAAVDGAERLVAGRDENIPLLSDIDGRRSESQNSTQTSRSPSTEARDRMLAEMARAFQLGLGLNSSTANNGAGLGSPISSDASSLPFTRAQLGELPPEGSFERFLVDLQTDLRVALSGGRQQQQQQPQQQQDTQEPEDDEHEGAPSRREHDSEIDELFRLIAEAEAEVRERQRTNAERQAALRALVSGSTSPSADSLPSSPPAAIESTEPATPPQDLRARVETVHDDDEDVTTPTLVDVSDDSDSEDEGLASNTTNTSARTVAPSSPNTTPTPATERTEATLARLAGMPSVGGGAGATNSIQAAINRRRALGIGRTPPSADTTSVAPALRLPPLSPVREAFPTPLLSPSRPALSLNTSPILPSIPSHSSIPSTIPTSSTAPAVSTMNATEELPSTLPTSPSEPLPTNLPQPQGRNAVNDANGRINWWRLYRFPPIAAPPPRGARTNGNDTSNAAVSSSPPPPPPATTSPLQDSPLLQSDAATPSEASDTASTAVPSASPNSPGETDSQAPPQQAAPNTVVPVIVVGLQSVNLTMFGPGGNGANNAAAAGGAPMNAPTSPIAVSPTSLESRVEGETSPVDGGTDDGDRQRRWPSRAADALRNLRPGRRPQHRPGAGLLPPEMLDGPGSRTFLIYVIGGYYPPDHNIVTGDPDSLDSFEALLDLAELLGQTKPPTASKEEIERSGLEVIKTSQVSQYEQEGKISSNCTERCLICLDEYETEDDVRVLTCKHAFHMDCVDKWFQEGKNNCPACRGAGVSTGSS